MELKNYEISNINSCLGQLVDQKMRGKLKFKLFRTKAELETCITIIQNTLNGVDDEEEKREILEESQTIYIEKFTEEELEDLPLSMREIGILKPIIGDDQHTDDSNNY